MDPLSISASIAGLVTLADVVFRAGLRYMKSVKNAPKDVKELLEEIKDLSLLLHNLSMVAYGLEMQPEPQNKSTAPKPYHLHECRQLLRRLEASLPNLEGQSSLNKLQGRLKWPFSAGDNKEMMEAIGRYKQTINISLAAESIAKLQLCLSLQEDTAKEIQDLKEEIRKVQDIETKITLNKKRNEVLNTFISVNPRSEFETNRELRHPLTALWLTEGAEFDEWFSTPKARVWCSGIPGAGKSVIAAAIIDECLQRLQGCPGTAVCYFFCAYRDSNTTQPCNILSALCYQLALQHEEAYQVLEEYHDELHPPHQLPGQVKLPRLMKVLHQICRVFDRVYLVVDGLDECGDNTGEIVNCLVQISIATANENINVALLSRDEFIIREMVESDFHWIEIEAHTEDIQLYVASEMNRLIDERKLRLRDPTVKDEIMTKLVREAKGMFRWVACQLDHLCQLPTDKARRRALHELPPTLPATYERILRNVETYSKEAKRLVQRVLLLLLSRVRNMPSQALCEAVSISDTSDRLDEDETMDEQEVLRWCGSLVRLVPGSSGTSTFQFAHFTVQEFLTSDFQEYPILNIYGISHVKSTRLFAELALRFLTLKNFERCPQADLNESQRSLELRQLHPFYAIASKGWDCLILDETDGSAWTHLCNLFHLDKTPNFCTWAIEVIRQYIEYNPMKIKSDTKDILEKDVSFLSGLLRPDFTPLHMAAALGLEKVCRHLLNNGAEVNLMSRYGNPLHCAVGGFSVFNDLDLQSFASYSFTERKWLNFISAFERRKIAQLLLREGAQICSRLHTHFQNSSLLSLAVASGGGHVAGLGIVADLIESGVDVEEEDLSIFSHTYSSLSREFCPDEFKEEYSDGRDVLETLNALASLQPSDMQQRSSQVRKKPEVRLYNMTFQFAREMRLEIPENMVESTIAGDIGGMDLPKLVSSAIRDNDVALLRGLPLCQRSRLPELSRLDEESPDWTVLHLSVNETSLDCLRLLLDWGFDTEVRDRYGRTPMHLCCEDENEELLRALLDHGSNPQALDNASETVWHSSAGHNSTRILKILIQRGDWNHALKTVSDEGDTPICRAIRNGHKESAEMLLEYCRTKDHWKLRDPIYNAAAELGSYPVLQALLDIGIEYGPGDDSKGNPLYYVNPCSDMKCVELLQGLVSLEEPRKMDSQTPFELFLLRACTVEKCDTAVAMSLLPGYVLLSPERFSAIWSFICLEAIPKAISQGEWPWLGGIIDGLLEKGIQSIYEKQLGVSALKPFATGFCGETFGETLRNCKDGKYFPVFCFNRVWYRRIFQSIAESTRYRNEAANDLVMRQALCKAIMLDEESLAKLLLEFGVDCHSQVGVITPFEVACLPNVNHNGRILGLLLKYTPTENLTRKVSFGKIGFLHLTVGLHPWARQYDASPDKLKRLLDAGANPNLPSEVISPILHHILSRSMGTAQMLLDAGADPWFRKGSGFDSALAAIVRHNPSFLTRIFEHSTLSGDQPQWGHTWTSSSYLEGKHILRGGNALHLAAHSGQVEVLKFYLEKRLLTDLEVEDAHQETPMHYAARGGFVPVVQFLVERGCNIDATSRSGMTPLHLASQKGHFDCVKALLYYGAKQLVSNEGSSPTDEAYYSGDKATIDLLKASHEDSNANISTARVGSERKMARALKKAIEGNDVDACQGLHSLGCPMDIEIDSGITPLMFAISKQRSVDLVQWLLENNCKVSTLVWHKHKHEERFCTALHAALMDSAYNPLIELLVKKYLQELGNFPSQHPNPLAIAISSENTKGLLLFLEAVKKNHHQVALSSLLNLTIDWVVQEGPLHVSARFDNLEAFRALVDSGASMEKLDNSFYSPLHSAADYDSISVAEYIISSGACLEKMTGDGKTPLLIACFEDSYRVLQLLVESGSVLDAVDSFGNNALCLLTDSVDCARLPPNVKALKVLVDSGIDLFARNVVGLDAAHYMLANHSSTYLRHILNRFPGVLNNRSLLWPPMWTWCQLSGLFSVTTAFLSISKNLRLVRPYLNVEEFLQVANLSTPGEHSLFCQSALWGLAEVAQNFLELGAEVEHMCQEHGTPLVAALTGSRSEVVKILVRRGANMNQLIGAGVLCTQTDDELKHWLLVGRHCDQAKLAAKAWDEGRVLAGRAGVVPAVVEMEWRWKRKQYETMLEYAKRLQEVIRELRGTQVKVVGLFG